MIAFPFLSHCVVIPTVLKILPTQIYIMYVDDLVRKVTNGN